MTHSASRQEGLGARLQNDGGPATFNQTVLLAGERGLVPFAALLYWNLGYELTADVTCIRTVESYQRWQLTVYAGPLLMRNRVFTHDYRSCPDTPELRYQIEGISDAFI